MSRTELAIRLARLLDQAEQDQARSLGTIARLRNRPRTGVLKPKLDGRDDLLDAWDAGWASADAELAD